MKNELTKFVTTRLIIINLIILLILIGNISNNYYIINSVIFLFVISNLITIINYIYSKNYYPLFCSLSPKLKKVYDYEVSIFSKKKDNEIKKIIILFIITTIIIIKFPLNYLNIVNINFPILLITTFTNIEEIHKLFKIKGLTI